MSNDYILKNVRIPDDFINIDGKHIAECFKLFLNSNHCHSEVLKLRCEFQNVLTSKNNLKRVYLNKLQYSAYKDIDSYFNFESLAEAFYVCLHISKSNKHFMEQTAKAKQ